VIEEINHGNRTRAAGAAKTRSRKQRREHDPGLTVHAADGYL
jgi:hypothetical protein